MIELAANLLHADASYELPESLAPRLLETIAVFAHEKTKAALDEILDRMRLSGEYEGAAGTVSLVDADGSELGL